MIFFSCVRKFDALTPYTHFKKICYLALPNSTPLCEYSLEFFREPHFLEGLEEVGKQFFLKFVNFSPKLKLVLASASTQIKLKY